MEIVKRTDYFGKLPYYYYGQAYYGSSSYGDDSGVRYMIYRRPMINLFEHPEELKNSEARIVAEVWPEPYCHDVMVIRYPDQVRKKEFSFSEAGMEDACCWINDNYNLMRG